MGSNGCYDAATLAALQTRLALDFESVADGVQAECLSRPLGHGMEEALKAETLRADPDALGRLMADHTQVHVLQTTPVCAGSYHQLCLQSHADCNDQSQTFDEPQEAGESAVADSFNDIDTPLIYTMLPSWSCRQYTGILVHSLLSREAGFAWSAQ